MSKQEWYGDRWGPERAKSRPQQIGGPVARKPLPPSEPLPPPLPPSEPEPQREPEPETRVGQLSLRLGLVARALAGGLEAE